MSIASVKRVLDALSQYYKGFACFLGLTGAVGGGGDVNTAGSQ